LTLWPDPHGLGYGPADFYERHLAHISRRRDVWYVPMGPLYAYRTIHDRTEIRAISAGDAKARFELSNHLDPKIYSGSITVEFLAPAGIAILSGGRKLTERGDAIADRWDAEYSRREGGRPQVTAGS